MIRYKEHSINRGIHNIWFAESGIESGIPVVIFHGGPGSKSKDKHLDNFDLEKYRIIQIDQRGCGKSTPLGETKENTLKHLVDDVEEIRKYLEIEKWFVVGASWGSTVALKYSIEYPNSINGLLLSSIFLARKEDSDWLLGKQGVGKIFPDLLERRTKAEQKLGIKGDDLYSKAVEVYGTGNLEDQQEITAIIENWEGNLMSLKTDFEFVEAEDVTEEDILSAKIFSHYSTSNFFLAENEIISNIDKIRNIPTYILHGRYDMVCPLENAYTLKKSLNKSELVITNMDGHSISSDSRSLIRYMFGSLVDTTVKAPM